MSRYITGERHPLILMSFVDCLSCVIGVPKTSVAASQGMDVDLRQLPAVIGKKRPSTEAAESSATKKNKTEMFDV